MEKDVAEEVIWRDSPTLIEAGCFSLLFAGIPADLSTRISNDVPVPTILGFGAGDACEGQIGVTHGVLGFNAEELDRPIGRAFFGAAGQFVDDVRAGKSVGFQRDRQESSNPSQKNG